MKKTYTFLILLVSGLVLGFSFVPSQVVVPLLDIFNSKNTEVDGQMLVRVSTFNLSGMLKQNGDSELIPMADYKNYVTLSSAVFRMQKRDWRGTAFHIGNNLVLTNWHILNRNMDSKRCGDFELKDRSGKDEFPCRKVHFCHKEQDFCLVEMGPVKKKTGCFLCEKERYYVSMSEGPALKISGNYAPKKGHVLTAIGNSMGLGIHLSKGKGVRQSPSILHFFAPISGGNSGGPLLNEEGLVVGVINAETVLRVGDDMDKTYNVAANAKFVIVEIRKALKDDPETLEKFNQSVIE